MVESFEYNYERCYADNQNCSPDDKMRVNSYSWDGLTVELSPQVGPPEGKIADVHNEMGYDPRN